MLVDTNGIHDNSTYHEQSVTEIPRAVRLREEQLDIVKERVKVGELQLHKEIVEEQRTVQVPLIRRRYL